LGFPSLNTYFCGRRASADGGEFFRRCACGDCIAGRGAVG
jgi:hypothetical protein